MANFDDIDKKIINRIQSDFPIAERPYKVIADELDMDEALLLERVSSLKEAGFIRRIGGNFGPEKLGFTSTLCAAKVPSDKIDAFAAVVNEYPGVTHNYLRENDYNVWFTFISPSMDEIKKNLEEIKEKTGVYDVLNLPATDVFKIRAQFKL
jgi:DNA-binding Lrp family transcriptional regulator